MWNIGRDELSLLIPLIDTLCDEDQAAVRLAGDTSNWLEMQREVSQGCILCPHLFNSYAEKVMRNVKSDENCDAN